MSDHPAQLRFYDDHLHLPSPDRAGLDRLLRHVDAHPSMIGGNLILNTRDEVDFVDAHIRVIPPSLTLVSYYPLRDSLPTWATRSGWYKLHPIIARIDSDTIPFVCNALRSPPGDLRGLIVHCYPWGTTLQYEISLPFVIALARALPDTPIIATHGGGYQSWAFRAHTGSLANVLYDFAVTMTYFDGSDILKPFQVYLTTRPQRLLFGSDWPSAEPQPQLAASLRLAEQVGISPDSLSAVLLDNALRFWPRPDLDAPSNEPAHA